MEVPMTLIFEQVLAIVDGSIKELSMADDIAGKGTKPRFTQAEIAERRKADQEAAHQLTMEGMPPDPAFADLHEAHIRGDMTAKQVGDAAYDRIMARRKSAGATKL